MSKRLLLALLVLSLFGSLSAAAVSVPVPSSSRDGVEIPAYITLPASYSEAEDYPFVIMIHGHGGNHNEFGGFDPISDGLAAEGYIVATLDFPGCGASTESFTLNTMTNMKSDIKDVISYVADNFSLDESRIGAFGYSMGGRLVLELLGEGYDIFSAVELVAPAEDLEDLKGLFGGYDNWQVLRREAEENGYVEYTTIYSTLPLSIEWFEDLETDGIVERAKENYTGPSLVMWAVDDESVRPHVSQYVADVFDSDTLILPSGGHSYGFYSDDPLIRELTFNSSIDWFIENL